MPDELSQPLENSSRDIENGLTLEWFLQNDELGSFRDGFGERFAYDHQGRLAQRFQWFIAQIRWFNLLECFDTARN